MSSKGKNIVPMTPGQRKAANHRKLISKRVMDGTATKKELEEWKKAKTYKPVFFFNWREP